MSHLLDVIQDELAEIDTFGATLAAPAVGSGGGYCVHQRIQTDTRERGEHEATNQHHGT